MFGQLAKKFSLPLIRLCGIIGCCSSSSGGGGGGWGNNQLWRQNNRHNNNNWTDKTRQLIGTGISSIGLKRTHLFDEFDMFDIVTKYVRIIIQDINYNRHSTGTGFLICGQLGDVVYAVTCAHVTEQMVSCNIYDYNNTLIGFGQILYCEPQLDLALIRFIDYNNTPTIEISEMDGSDLEFGDEVITIGVPTNYHQSCDWSPGIVNNPYSQFPRDFVGRYSQLYNTVDVAMVHTTAEMIAGTSGGPVFNSGGKLVSYQVSGSPRFRYFFGGQIALVYDFFNTAYDYSNRMTIARLQEHELQLGLTYTVQQIDVNMVFIQYNIVVPSYGNYQLMNDYDDWGVIYEINGQPIPSERDFREAVMFSDNENPLAVQIDIGGYGYMSDGFIWLDDQMGEFKIV
ncbi:uncharacterized protein LOC128962373 [Oppia nitens]|uniref:uncharacterized protein LOC128962373 n=1 Tax=Oppia nitens TaxID=1686743 RepID=UPI0023D9AD2B|nr:uncharacterized protein LOC128962373 [Oppia nitens]